jgi:hypothetical protein
MSLKLKNSIILFDEPDLHLHATLQRKVLQHLLRISDSGNQLFIATHALEMISEAKEENIYHLSKYVGESQLKNLNSEKDKLAVFNQLGASKYTFVNFKKIVFLEGISDYNLLRDATKRYNLRYEHIGGISKLTPEILQNASHIESFFMIRDKDFLDLDEIMKEESKYNNRVCYLKRRKIENYILDDDALYEVINKTDKSSFKTKYELIKKLFEIATEQIEQTIVDCYVFRSTRDVNLPEMRLKKGERAESGLRDAFNTKESRLKNSINRLDEEIPKFRAKIKENWNDTWLTYCDGSNVLKQFSDRYGAGKSFEDIRDMVSIIWDTKGILPKELDDLVRKIASS